MNLIHSMRDENNKKCRICQDTTRIIDVGTDEFMGIREKLQNLTNAKVRN